MTTLPKINAFISFVYNWFVTMTVTKCRVVLAEMDYREFVILKCLQLKAKFVSELQERQLAVFVVGSFLTVSVPDFYRYVKQLNANADVPNTAGQYNQWKSLPATQNEYVREIYRFVSCAVRTHIFVFLLLIGYSDYEQPKLGG